MKRIYIYIYLTLLHILSFSLGHGGKYLIQFICYFREIVLKGGDENYGNKYPENVLEFPQNCLSLD